MYLRVLKPSDLPAILALSDALFPQIDPRRAGLERVFENPNALALAVVVQPPALSASASASLSASPSSSAAGRGNEGAPSSPAPSSSVDDQVEIAAFVVAIVGDAEPGGARDGGSTAAFDYTEIRRAVLDADASLRSRPGAPAAAPATGPAPPALALSVRSARAGGPVRVGCVALLGVAEPFRRRGLAARLMRAAAAFCAAGGAAALYLHTPAGNRAAVALYERRLGFRRAALLPRYYGGREGGGRSGAGGTDALLFVWPLFGRQLRPGPPEKDGKGGGGRAAGAARAPPTLLLPRPPGREALLPRPLAPAPPPAPLFRADGETGEVALLDDEEIEAERAAAATAAASAATAAADAGGGSKTGGAATALLRRLAQAMQPPIAVSRPRARLPAPPRAAVGTGGGRPLLRPLAAAFPPPRRRAALAFPPSSAAAAAARLALA